MNVDRHITIIEYEWNNNTTERIVEPPKSEILGVIDWMMGGQELRELLSYAGLRNITITVRPFELSDAHYIDPTLGSRLIQSRGE